MFIHNFTEEEGQRVLAVCDKEVSGKVLEDGNIRFEVSEGFYGNEAAGEDEILDKAKDSSIINAVGNKVVSLLSDEGFFDEDRILKIDGVDHAQMVKF